MEKLNNTEKKALNFLLVNDLVGQFHKTLLKGIKGNNFKNVSIADRHCLEDLIRRYKLRGVNI